MYIYSITSMARTRMARLPWMIRTLFFSPYKILPIAQENKYLMIISYLMSTLNIQLLYRKLKNKSPNYRHLLPDLAPKLTLIGSNHPCLEQFCMVPKMFEPSKFDCIWFYNGELDIPSIIFNYCLYSLTGFERYL